ncbi:hypothetical protein NDU88_007274, partial [Pleurodeles waltl]
KEQVLRRSSRWSIEFSTERQALRQISSWEVVLHCSSRLCSDFSARCRLCIAFCRRGVDFRHTRSFFEE